MNERFGTVNKGGQAGLKFKKLCAFAAIIVSAGIFHLSVSAQSNLPLRSPLVVDPRDLNANPTISLGSYTGRNGDQTTIELNYSSANLWHGDISTDDSGGMFIHNYISPVFNYSSGWSNSLDLPEVSDADAYAIYDGDGNQVGVCPDQPQSFYSYVKRISVSIPGVGTHELRKDDLLHNTVCTNRPPPDLSGVFYSVDGSKLRYDNDAKILYMPNGGRYFFESVNLPETLEGGLWGTKYTDPNGNTRTYNVAGGYWTDTLGRQFVRPKLRNREPGEQIMTFPGLNNSSLTYTLKWEKLEQALAPGRQLHYRGDKNCLVLSHTNQPTGSYLPALFKSSAPNYVCADNNPNDVNNPLKFNPVVLTEARLPNGQKYQYKYTPYGELEKIIYPTGGYQRFRYVSDVCHFDTANGTLSCEQVSQSTDPNVNRYVAERWLSPNETGNDEIRWQYPAFYRTIRPDGVSEFVNLASEYYTTTKYGFTDIRGRLASVTQSFTVSNGQMQSRSLGDASVTMTTFPAVSGKVGYTTTRDPRTSREINIVFESSNPDYALATMSHIEYDSHSDPAYFAQLNPIRVKRYDYVVVPRATAQTGSFETLATYFDGRQPTAITETDYFYDTAYEAKNINTLPIETRVLKTDGVTVAAKSQIVYDEAIYLEAATGFNVIGWENPNTTLRGLPTTSRSWTDVTDNQYVETHTMYDQFGNVRKVWDGRGNVSEIRYADNYADGVNRNSYALPTKTISAVPGGNGSQAAFETTVKYDFNTGLPTSSKDANNLETRMEYNDPLLRPTKVQQYFGGLPIGATSETVYGAGTSEATRFVKSRTQIDETKWKEGFSWYDGLARPVKSQSVDSAGDVFTKTLYDAVGRVSKTSNPYRGANTADNQLEWTEVQYDAAGRAWKTITPDGAAVQTAYALATTGDTIGTVVTVTDQALKQRRSITNALGQLKRVDEPTDAGGLGAVNIPNQPTYYSYDILNNLTTVQQGGQTRSFAYDSLSRLKSATNPESGLIQYQYDDNGNLTKKTDARLVETNYGYDALNRVLTRSYAAPANLPNYQATPTVTYTYDNLPNAKGKLTKVTNGFSTTDYQIFDEVGRVKQSQQTTDSATYGEPMTYTYNLSGAMVEQKYPSTRVVKNVLDADGDLALVQSKKNGNAGFFNYAKSFTYTAAGAMSSMQLGNGKWESTVFNSRLQPTQIALGTVQNGADKLKLNFDYGTTANNGNVLSQTITVPTETRNNTTYAAFTNTQNYSYDSLNRLKQADEKPIGYTQAQCDQNPAQCWKQTFTYDRFGNRNFDTANGNTTTLPLNCATAVCNPTVDPNTNKLVGYLFDNAGNTKTDANGQTFIYDGENKQTEVKNSSGVSIGKYYYDGDGKRVKKIALENNQSVTTVFVYDAAGKLVAEYANQISATPQVSYLTSDGLGSPRINTDANGAVISRHDYHPFGEEIARPSYGNDEIRKQFTAYERDIESELDFAQARYYNKNHGRFTSADEPFADQYEDNPQSWNLYSYVRNNPLNMVDPSGMKADDCPLGKICILDKNDKIESVEDDKKPLVIEVAVKRVNQFYRGFQNVGSWFRHLFSRRTSNPPTSPAPTSQPNRGNQTSQPNQVYGPPSPPAQSGPSTVLQFNSQQVQRKFKKHASDFGVQGNYNGNNAQQFINAIQNHTTSPNTQVINGTYRGQQVTHHFNPVTQLNVITDRAGNFVSGWKLNPAQAQNVTTRGSL